MSRRFFQPFLVVLTLTLGAAMAPGADQAPKLLPLNKTRLMQSLEYRVLTVDQIIERIAARGVDFELSDADWQSMTRKGASSRLITAVRGNYRPTGAADAKAANAKLPDAQMYAGPPLMRREVELMMQMKVPLEKVTQAVGARGVEFTISPDLVRQVFDLGGNLAFVGELLLNSRSEEKPMSPEELFAAVRNGDSPSPTPAPVAPAPAKTPILVASSTPVAPPQPAVAKPQIPEVRTVQAPPPVPTPVPAPAATPAAAVVSQEVRRLSVDPGLQATKLVKQQAPVYPADARARQIAGAVRLELVIGVDGKVISARPLAGHPTLAAAATSAVKQWQYRPTIIDNRAVEVSTMVEIRFTP